MRKRWKILLGLGGVLFVAALMPIVYVETQCTAPLPGLDAAGAFRSRLPDQAGRRPEAQTWLTYPEWYIVYSAETYGRYLAAGNPPSGFGHWRQISGFWSGLCAVNRASAASGGAGDAKVMLYTIGLSFSAEMLVKAAYENTFGRLAEWIGGQRSDDDATMPGPGGLMAGSCTKCPGIDSRSARSCPAYGAPAPGIRPSAIGSGGSRSPSNMA